MPVEANNDIRIPVIDINGTVKTCRVCGCSDFDACIHEEHGNCYWIEKDLCSHCKLFPGEATRYSILFPNHQINTNATGDEKESA
jgi:hypothetical protein